MLNSCWGNGRHQDTCIWKLVQKGDVQSDKSVKQWAVNTVMHGNLTPGTETISITISQDAIVSLAILAKMSEIFFYPGHCLHKAI